MGYYARMIKELMELIGEEVTLEEATIRVKGIQIYISPGGIRSARLLDEKFRYHTLYLE